MLEVSYEIQRFPSSYCEECGSPPAESRAYPRKVGRTSENECEISSENRTAEAKPDIAVTLENLSCLEATST